MSVEPIEISGSSNTQPAEEISVSKFQHIWKQSEDVTPGSLDVEQPLGSPSTIFESHSSHRLYAALLRRVASQWLRVAVSVKNVPGGHSRGATWAEPASAWNVNYLHFFGLSETQVQSLPPRPSVVWASSASVSRITQETFSALVSQWKRNTEMTSSMTEMAMHPAYQRIIGMGTDAIPLLLRELEDRPDHWFWALKAISGDDPVRPEQRGKLKEMVRAWLAWGSREGYVW